MFSACVGLCARTVVVCVGAFVCKSMMLCVYVAGIGAETGEVDGERYEEAVCVIKEVQMSEFGEAMQRCGLCGCSIGCVIVRVVIVGLEEGRGGKK